MLLSKPIRATETNEKVLEFQMPKIQTGIPEVAMEAVEFERRSRDFKIAEMIREKTGVKELEARNLEDLIERRVLEKLKEIQEMAYKEAYDLGRTEGKEQAFNQFSDRISSELANLQQVCASIESLKTDLVAYNETHLVELSFRIAEKLAAYEIAIEPSSTVEILKQAVSLAQSEEEILVKVNPQHVEFLELLKQEARKDLEFLKRTKIEAETEVEVGGCIVITNYGEIDSRLKQRVENLWAELQGHLVRVKNELRSVS